MLLVPPTAAAPSLTSSVCVCVLNAGLLVHVQGWDASTDAWEPLASTRIRRQTAPEDPDVPVRPMPPALAAVMQEQPQAHHTVSGINVHMKAKHVALKSDRRDQLMRESQHTLTISGLPLLADMIKYIFNTRELTAMCVTCSCLALSGR